MFLLGHSLLDSSKQFIHLLHLNYSCVIYDHIMSKKIFATVYTHDILKMEFRLIRESCILMLASQINVLQFNLPLMAFKTKFQVTHEIFFCCLL